MLALADLKKLLKVLQENGVTHYVTSELTLTIEAKAPEQSPMVNGVPATEERELTQEELMFFSVPTPEQVES